MLVFGFLYDECSLFIRLYVATGQKVIGYLSLATSIRPAAFLVL
jgi:hypothetical protein